MNQNPSPVVPQKSNGPWILIAVVIGILLVLGYGVHAIMKKATQKVGETMMERMIEDSTGNKADVDLRADGVMELKTKDGTFTTGHEMPKDWPKDAPTYPGAEVQYSASVNPTTGKPGQAVVLMTKDDVATVSAYFKAELEKQGWTVSAASEAGGGAMLGATKDGRAFSVMIVSGDGRTTVSIALGEE